MDFLKNLLSVIKEWVLAANNVFLAAVDSDESMSQHYSKREHHTSFLFDLCSICASELWHEGKKKKKNTF